MLIIILDKILADYLVDEFIATFGIILFRINYILKQNLGTNNVFRQRKKIKTWIFFKFKLCGKRKQ